MPAPCSMAAAASQELLKLRAMRNGTLGSADVASRPEAAAGDGEDWSQVSRKGAVSITRGDESLQV